MSKAQIWMAMLFTICFFAPSVMAWGGLFNRFSPEMLSNMGYGGHGGFGGSRAQPFLQRYESPSDIFQELQEAEEPCYGRKCTANEFCCPGSVCVDMDGLIGTCLFAYGLKQGELCRRDNDCETGLLCQETGEGRTCQPPLSNKKQYSEECFMSGECDVSKGLCCQLQRRHRQAPRKVCSYFKDPLVCIGPVATDQITNQVEHTAGEKRITGKLTNFNHIHQSSHFYKLNKTNGEALGTPGKDGPRKTDLRALPKEKNKAGLVRGNRERPGRDRDNSRRPAPEIYPEEESGRSDFQEKLVKNRREVD